MKEKIEKIIKEIEKDGNDPYFRISSENDDLQGSSIEYPNISRQEAADIWFVDVDDLDEELDALWLYYDDKKEGVFWDGICVSPSIEAMADYYRNNMGAGMGVEGLYLYIVTGDYITDTLVGDGEVIQNAKMVDRFDASFLSEWFD
tara:strand:- start:45 stop:482 length:438 start_codon:yes stop_codon:yes gene_type:complete